MSLSPKPGAINADTNLPHDNNLPPTDKTNRDLPFDSLKLYAGFQEVVNTRASAATQTSAVKDRGFPSVNLFNGHEDATPGSEIHATASDSHGELRHVGSTTYDTDYATNFVDGLLNSSNEDHQCQGQRLQNMLRSKDSADKGSARAIINMLGSDDYHQIAQTMLSMFSNTEINTMVQILNDPNRTAEADLFVGMMSDRENGLAGAFSVQRVLGMIGSTNGDTTATGQRVVDMLGNENQSELADRLLGLDEASLHQFLQTYDDPEQEMLANKLTDLLTSIDNTKVRVGAAILSMMSSNDGGERYAGGTLAEMLIDPEQSGTALIIAGRLDTPQPRMQMLELLNDPAGERLLKMLGNEDQQRLVVDFLNLLSSPFEMDRRDGDNLLKIFSIANSSAAERVLTLGEPQYLHHLTEILANPATRPAGTQLLNMFDSQNRRDCAAVNDFIQSMENPSKPVRERNNQLIGLLSNENTAVTARTLMVKFQDQPNALTQVLSLLQINLDNGRRIATMLGGTPEECNAAKTIIEMREREQNQNPVGAPRTMPEDAEIRPRPEIGAQQHAAPRMSDQMLTMLANQNDSAQALTILSSLNAAQVNTFMSLRKPFPNAFKHMTAMMQNGKTESVRNLLQTNDDPDEADDELDEDRMPAAARPNKSIPAIVAKLDNPQDTEDLRTAETLMAHLTISEQYSNMIRLLTTNGYQAEATQLTQMLADPRRAGDATTLLSNLNQPAQIRTMLNLLGDENRRNQSQRLMQMLPTRAAHLLDMLGSTKETTRQTGKKLLTMLDTDDYFDAQNIINSRATPAQSQVLINLLSDRKTAPTARRLLNGDGDSMLGMLNQDDTSGDAARRILTMLGSETESQLVDNILSLGRSHSIQAVVEVLNHPDRRQAAEQLRTFLASTAAGSRELENLSLLMSSTSQEAGAQLIQMLNTPAQQADVNAILRRPSSPERARQMLQMLSEDATRPLATHLVQMLQSPQSSQSHSVESWLRVLTNPTADSDAGINHINEMLTDPQRREQAIAVLSGLQTEQNQRRLAILLSDRNNNASVQQIMSMLTSGDQRQIAGVRSLLILRDDELFAKQDRGVRHAPETPTTQLLQMLTAASTQAAARDILSAAASPEQLTALFQISRDPQYTESSNRIFAALRNPQQEQRMRAVLDRIDDPKQLNQMVKLMNDANYSRAAQALTGILQDDEQSPFGVVNLMDMLTTANSETHQAGRALLDMLNSDDSISERNATDILVLGSSLRSGSITQLMNIMRSPANQNASSEIMELLRNEGSATALVLFDLLQSTNPAQQEQGRKFLSQLNSYHTAPCAIRALETRAVRSLP